MTEQLLNPDDDALVIGIKIIPTVLIWLNEGQIPGLPANPKYMEEKGGNDLKNSISEDPEYLHARPLIVVPYADQFVVICGNGRLRCCIDLKIIEVPCIVLNPKTPVEKLKRYMLKDNINNGKWDWDMLANDFEVPELEHLGLDLPFMHEPDDEQDLSVSEKTEKYTLTLECGSNKQLYEQLKLKIAPLIEELQKQGLEIRG